MENFQLFQLINFKTFSILILKLLAIVLKHKIFYSIIEYYSNLYALFDNVIQIKLSRKKIKYSFVFLRNEYITDRYKKLAVKLFAIFVF